MLQAADLSSQTALIRFETGHNSLGLLHSFMTTQILAPNFYIDQMMDSTDAVRELKQASHMLFGSPGDNVQPLYFTQRQSNNGWSF